MKVSMLMLILLCVCAAILTSLLVYSQNKSSNARSKDFDKLANEANALQLQVNELLNEQVRLSEELRAREKELAAAPEITTNEPPTEPKPTSPYTQAFFAKAFLDGDYVGLAKVSPVFRTDEKTGQTVFENIVNLSADARGAITKTVTNVVERDVVRNTTLNHNYSSRPNWYAYPAWIRPSPTNGIPGRPTPTPPIARPNQPNTGSGQFVRPDGTPYWQNGGVWNPGTIQKNPFFGNR